MTPTHATRNSPCLLSALVLALTLCASLPASAAPSARPTPPQVDTAALPQLGNEWDAINPLRGSTIALEVGHSAYNQSCARCHGADADGSRAPAPDLRRIGRSCKRVTDPALQKRCTEDADYYFRQSVLKGKIKLGIEHMPPWEGVLSPQVLWSIRSYVENAEKR